MQYTSNYNLKKPEGSDPVNIQDFNDNADTIDTELKKRVLASGGDISNTKISTADSISTEFPVPAAGDTPKTFLGKMKKFVEDFKNLKTGLLTVGMLVNNCVTANANLPLSAAQGKVLMDAITQLNGESFLLANLSGSSSSVISVKEDLETAFSKAPEYTLFSGQTKTGAELGWVAFKHIQSVVGVAFSKNISPYPIFINRNSSGLWTFYGRKS